MRAYSQTRSVLVARDLDADFAAQIEEIGAEEREALAEAKAAERQYLRDWDDAEAEDFWRDEAIWEAKFFAEHGYHYDAAFERWKEKQAEREWWAWECTRAVNEIIACM